jgi:UDP-glucose 4-epimerase
MARILVTGGAGMIGGHVIVSLCDEGHDVTVIDDLSTGRRERVPQVVRFAVGSILDDHCLKKAFSNEPEFVIHLATSFANQRSVDNPESDLMINGLGTLRVFESCVRYGVHKVLFSSSSCVYGNMDVMRERNTGYQPATPYAMTKLLCEQYAQFHAEQRGLNVVIARMFNAYGPNEYPEEHRNVIPKFFAQAIQRQPLSIMGSGDETRDFTFVSDIVDGIRLALFSQTRPGEIFNLASGVDTTVMELATSINALMGNTAGVVMQRRRDWDRVQKRRGDIEKARNMLGYDPKVHLQEGLKKTAMWFCEEAHSWPSHVGAASVLSRVIC